MTTFTDAVQNYLSAGYPLNLAISRALTLVGSQQINVTAPPPSTSTAPTVQAYYIRGRGWVEVGSALAIELSNPASAASKQLAFSGVDNPFLSGASVPAPSTLPITGTGYPAPTTITASGIGTYQPNGAGTAPTGFNPLYLTLAALALILLLARR